MLSLVLIFGLLSAVAFGLGAAGVQAKINWDQAGKALAMLTFLAYIGAISL